MLHLVRDVQHHQPRDVQVTRAVGEHPLDPLPVRKNLAERLPFQRMLSRHVQRPLRLGDAPHAVPQAAIAQPVLAHREPAAHLSDHVGVRNAQVPDADLGMAAGWLFPGQTRLDGLVQGRDFPDDLVAGVGQFDHERGELPVPGRAGIRSGHD